MERSNKLAEEFGIGEPISENFLGYVLAIMIVAGVLAFLESNISKKSAMSLFFLIVLGMILSQPLVLARLQNIIGKISGVYRNG